jgi:hypothetical protein
MPPAPRLTGEPIMRILCKKTDSLVGYLYQWDNGDLQPAWLKDAMADVRYEPIDQITTESPLDLQDSARKSHDPSHLQNV